MNNRIRSTLMAMSICLVPLVASGSAFAGTANPEQKQKAGVFLLSRTTATSVNDEFLAGIYQMADASLMDQVRDGLVSRDIPVKVVKTEQEITPTPSRFILIVKIEEIELGKKRPFGRTARVKVRYAFQNKERFELVRRTVEETSVQQWQNCIKKISDQIAADTKDDLAKYAAPGADGKGRQ